MVTVLAKYKYLRMSPKKVQPIANKIKGKTYYQSLLILLKTNKLAAGAIWQVLQSAVANATYLHNIDREDLIVKEIYVNKGPIMKRARCRAQGRIFQIQKKFSHITIKLSKKY